MITFPAICNTLLLLDDPVTSAPPDVGVTVPRHLVRMNKKNPLLRCCYLNGYMYTQSHIQATNIHTFYTTY